MKLTEYAFSLNVMFDYNEKDQRAASPAERDEYEDVNRQMGCHFHPVDSLVYCEVIKEPQSLRKLFHFPG